MDPILSLSSVSKLEQTDVNNKMSNVENFSIYLTSIIFFVIKSVFDLKTTK